MKKIINLLNSSTRKNKPKSVSTTYKKWLRYLKKNKLFDKYMIYMDYKYGDSGTYPYPSDYKELSVLVISLLSCAYIDVGNTYIHTYIHVPWYSEFLKFTKESVQWWNFYIKTKFLWQNLEI